MGVILEDGNDVTEGRMMVWRPQCVRACVCACRHHLDNQLTHQPQNMIRKATTTDNSTVLYTVLYTVQHTVHVHCTYVLYAVMYNVQHCTLHYISCTCTRRTRTRLGDRSFSVAGPCLWHSLPVALRATETSHLHILRDFWRHFGLCRAAAHSDCCFFAPCRNILTYLQHTVHIQCTMSCTLTMRSTSHTLVYTVDCTILCCRCITER